MQLFAGRLSRWCGCIWVASLSLAWAPLSAQQQESDLPPDGPPPARPYRIYQDFNNDGKKDLALSDASAWGDQGGMWQVYINREPGVFQFAGQAYFHPLAFHIHGIKPGMGRLVACVREEGGKKGRLISYAINDSSVTETVSTTMTLGAFGDPDDLIKYDMLFGHLRKVNFHLPFEPGDFEITQEGTLKIDPPEMLDEVPEFVRLDRPPQQSQ